ncbi:MAG: DUF58 domain-containing protein [Candidatus Eremiobacteraeota bacterium]|nr:DUF58 domain-containing protein [Candidatus Eremiobacteraeota bacterium]
MPSNNTKHKQGIYTFFSRLLRYRFTVMGRFMLAMGIVLILLGSYTIIPTFILYCLGFFYILIFFLSPFIGRLSLPQLDAGIKIPFRTSSGSTVREKITLKNKTGRNAYFIFVREENLPEEISPGESEGVMVPLLKKGEEIDLTLNLFMKKRGNYSLESIYIETSFPLGIVKTGYPVKRKRNILAYPSFTPILHLNIPAGMRLQPGGIALASKVGESTEFIGTREFRDGDSPRHIHWKSWARFNKPIVKEFQEEYFCRIALFIDTFVPKGSPPKDYDAFESSLSLAASISDYLERQEYIIDIIAAGPDIYYLQAGRALAYLDQILDILACLDVCRDRPYSRIEPHLMEELSGISTVIVLLLDWDDERRDFLNRIKEMGIEIRIFIIANDREGKDIAQIEDIFGSVTLLDSKRISMGFDEL